MKKNFFIFKIKRIKRIDTRSRRMCMILFLIRSTFYFSYRRTSSEKSCPFFLFFFFTFLLLCFCAIVLLCCCAFVLSCYCAFVLLCYCAIVLLCFSSTFSSLFVFFILWFGFGNWELQRWKMENGKWKILGLGLTLVVCWGINGGGGGGDGGGERVGCGY